MENQPESSPGHELASEKLQNLYQEFLRLEGSGNIEKITEVLIEYRIEGERVISELEGEQYHRGQVALMLAMGFLEARAGLRQYEVSDLTDAFQYSEQMGLDDLAGTIREILVARKIILVNEEDLPDLNSDPPYQA